MQVRLFQPSRSKIQSCKTCRWYFNLYNSGLLRSKGLGKQELETIYHSPFGGEDKNTFTGLFITKMGGAGIYTTQDQVVSPAIFSSHKKNASHFIFFVTPVLKYTINNVNSRQSVPGCKRTLRFIFCCLCADDRLAFLYSHLNSLLPYSILECLECLCYNYHHQEPIPPDSKKVLTPDGVVNKQTQTSHY